MPKPRRSVAEIEQAERAEQLREAFEQGLLIDLRNVGDSRDDQAARRSAQKIVADSYANKLDAALAEVEELKTAAGNTADFDAAVQRATVAEAELEKFTNGLAAVLAEEMKKLRQSVNNETGALAAREVTVKRKEDVLETSTSAQLTLRAFDFLSTLIRRMPSWEPKDFFDPTIPKSPWLLRIWMPEDRAKNFCAWENEISAKPREQQTGLIAHELHVRTCIQHQYEKIDLSEERKEFLEARARHMGIENEVYEIGRQMTSQCMLKGHPMPSHANIDEAYLANQRNRILLGEVPTGDSLMPEWIA